MCDTILTKYIFHKLITCVVHLVIFLISQALLDLGNGLSWIQVFGTNFRAVHDCVAAVQLKGVVHCCQALAGPLSWG
jgi:hypothetical protein